MYKNACKFFGRNRSFTKHVTFNNKKSYKRKCPCCDEEILKADLRTHLKENHLEESFIRCEFCNDVVWEEKYTEHLSTGHHDYAYNMLQSEKNNHSPQPYYIKEKRFDSNFVAGSNNPDKRFETKLLRQKTFPDEKLAQKCRQAKPNKKFSQSKTYTCLFCNYTVGQDSNHENYCKPRLLKKR